MPGSPVDVKLVSNAMANATRRKIMSMLVESNRTQDEISKFVGPTMLDYHLQMLRLRVYFFITSLARTNM